MFVDKGLLVSNGQVTNNDNADEVSENCIDLGVTNNYIGKGEPLYAVIVVDAAPTGTGTTLQYQVITSTADDLTTGAVVICQTAAIAKGNLTAGRVIVLAVPPLPEDGGDQRYLGINYHADGTMETTGTHTAFFTFSPQTNVF